jgi:hypothetical protein
MNKAGVQANNPLSAKEALVNLIQQARWAIGTCPKFVERFKGKFFELKFEFEAEINYDRRFTLAEEILQKGKARGWLGRDQDEYRKERRKLYASLMASLLEKLLISCKHEEASPEVTLQLTLLSQLLEESLLLSNKDKASILRPKMIWVYYQNLANGLIQWAQKFSNQELANNDHPPFFNEWLEVANQLQQGWEFEKKPEQGYQVIPKPGNRWLVIENKANNFKCQLREKLKQVKKRDAKKSGNQLNGEVAAEELKTLIYFKLFSAPTIEVAEKLCEKIIMGLEELADERKQLTPLTSEKPPSSQQPVHDQPEVEFLLASEVAKAACSVLGLNSELPVTITQIKKAYHEQAIQCHPDKVELTGLTQEAATEKFKALYGAMETVIAELKKNPQPAVGVVSWEMLYDFLEQVQKEHEQNAEWCKQLAQEQKQFKQESKQELEEQKQQDKQQRNLLLTPLEDMASSPEQLEKIKQAKQQFAEQKLESVKPPEPTATSSTSVQSPQTKEASRQWYTSSISMWPTPADDTHWSNHEKIQQLEQHDLAKKEEVVTIIRV